MLRYMFGTFMVFIVTSTIGNFNILIILKPADFQIVVKTERS